MSALVSVIIPCYNQAQFLPDAIKSLIAQTYKNWECILVNDGSTDNTKEVAQIICQQDKRFIYIEQNNQGLSAARNTGLQNASGNYIQFLDCDDAILSTKLAEQISLIKETNSPSVSICDFFYCAENNINERVIIEDSVSPELDPLDPVADLVLRWEDGLSIPVHCFLFDAKLFENIRFETSLPNHEDWDCWINVFRQSPKFYFLRKKLASYRLHESSMTANKLKMYAGFLSAIKRQKNGFKTTDRIFKLLSDKEATINERYRKEINYINFQRRQNNKLIKAFKKHTPWPIQKIIAKLNIIR